MNFPLLKIRLVICFLNSDVSRSISQTSAASLLKESNSVLQKKKTLKEKSTRKGKTLIYQLIFFFFLLYFFLPLLRRECLSSLTTLQKQDHPPCMPRGKRNAVLFQAIFSSFTIGTKFMSTISQFI